MKTKSLRKVLLGLSATALSCTMVLSGVLPTFSRKADVVQANPTTAESDGIKNITGSVDLDLKDYLDKSVVQKLSDKIDPDREISVMLALDTETLLDGYDELKNTSMSVADFAVSRQGKAIANNIERENRTLQSVLDRSGLKYQLGTSYNTLMGGFEVIIRAGEFEKLQSAVGKRANVFVSEEYSVAATDIVENHVDMQDSGIFDSSSSEYDGDGTVIAVLDTGLDYTHSAFSESRFHGKEIITLQSLTKLMNENMFSAAKRTEGLTAANVYYNKKVPFTYDYADSDPDVYPVNSEHGTHVAGIMVGLDEPDKIAQKDAEGNPMGIRGVAPQAQLAVMKVFSESAQGAKQSWIVAALEDCVLLGVDVVNMSLGSSAGFSREVDSDQRAAVYDEIRSHGISMVCAASNDGSSFTGSEKNGDLSLTSNPDTSTVGSPSTYDSTLSVASIAGVKTPYLKYGEEVIYFNEARNHAGEERHFVTEVFERYKTLYGEDIDSKEFEYITVDGVGSSTDYNLLGDVSFEGKIALVRRGQTNFEDKVRVAMNKGAIGIIIYNNVSGDILMTIGNVEFPACSVSRDDGEVLASNRSGKIFLSKSQTAGPFMSDFSSWGPTPDLGIKPEITAHGGEIFSSVPGQGYERMSGTSMACPNQAGFTALVRQYVKENFPSIKDDPVAVMETVNQLMMSTADIAYNTNTLPFAVRKQGAGLANLTRATNSPALIRTYDRDEPDKILDKAKIEVGDDPDKTGVYTLKFQIYNFKGTRLTYDIDAFAMTEGVSPNRTERGDTTVTEKGYMLEGAKAVVKSVDGVGVSSNSVSVNGNTTVTVVLEITLSGNDKAYLDSSFANGSYVEGFVTLTATDGTTYNLNVPYLAFYGDWTRAPLFDLDYFETSRDELDSSIPSEDKLLPDARTTIPVGGMYDDYIAYLGSFAYVRDPASTLIVPADRDKIALTNQEGEDGGINELSAIWCGLLRGAKRMVLTITDSATGEVIYTVEDYNRQKSLGVGGGTFSFSTFDVDFKVRDYNLKNNTKYDVKLTAYLDYKDGVGTNLRNTFEFSFYTDFEAPIATGVEYTYEFDEEKKTNRVFANVSIYDNHYTMGYIASSLSENKEFDSSDPENSFRYNSEAFASYIEPVIGSRNSTSVIQIELTDYIEDIKQSHNGRSFIVEVIDYALNSAIYEFDIPDEIYQISFDEMNPEDENAFKGVQISPNETYRLLPNIFPQSQADAWVESINYTSSNEDVVQITHGQLLGIAPGEATVYAASNRDPNVKTELTVRVLKEGDEGFVSYDRPVVEYFRLRGYYVNKVFYRMSNEDRDLGVDYAYRNGIQRFVSFNSAQGYNLKMFPSESITVEPEFKGYFDDENYKVEYVSSDENVLEVDRETGRITAKNVTVVDGVEQGQNTERIATVSVNLYALNADGEYTSTMYSQSITITVKKPYLTNGAYLMNYYGLGDRVVMPNDLRIEVINSFAFSNSDFVPKDLSAGDVIDEEDPYTQKQWFIGDESITEIVVSDRVKTIESYAFAGLTGLKKIVLPSTLQKIQTGAFYGCTSLETVEFYESPEADKSGANNLQFINEYSFYNCEKLASFAFDSIVGLGVGAFENANLISVNLPETAQSIGARAFLGNENLIDVTLNAASVKIGENAFLGCERLASMRINASVIPAGLFDGCSKLTKVEFGADVSVIAQNALRGTKIATISIDPENKTFEARESNTCLVEKETGKLALVAPTTVRFAPTDESGITSIGVGAFSAAEQITTVTLPHVTSVEDYAFANCASLRSLSLGTLESVGNYAFYGTSNLTRMPELAQGVTIGNYAFSESSVNNVTVPVSAKVGDYAFSINTALRTATVSEGAEIGEYAFYGDVALATVDIGNNVQIGRYAFAGMNAFDFLATYTGEIPDENNMLMFAATVDSGKQFPEIQENYTARYVYTLSGITSLKIGNDVKIGEGAFLGAGSGSPDRQFFQGSIGGQLKSVTLGTNAEIGDFAFYGARYLTSINLENAKSIGNYAFSGLAEQYMVFSNATIQVEDFATAPQIASLDLSKIESVGMYAFAYNTALTSVRLGDHTAVSAGAFDHCENLNKVEGPALEVVGARAFRGTAITEINLSENSKIGDSAFENATKLTKIQGLDQAEEIGSYAFANVPLESVAIHAKKLGDFAFVGTNLTSVTLSSNLEEVGENPFAGCAIGEFTREENGRDINTFDLAGGVKVIEGVLYRTKKNGLEAICYPTKKDIKDFTIAAGTVRIGAQAFLNASFMSVTIPRETASIGDRAFYGCEKLLLVTFKGIEAPRLEEEYQPEYDDTIDYELGGVPYYMRDSVGIIEIEWTNDAGEVVDSIESGLGFVSYRMWSYSPTTVLYGETFVAKVTSEELKNHPMVMVRPVNGTGYDSLIYRSYFSAVADGDAAPSATAIEVETRIRALPAAGSLKLSDYDTVYEILALYDTLNSSDKAYLDRSGDYQTLSNAKSIVDSLKASQSGSETPGGEEKEEEDRLWLWIVIGVFGGIILIAVIVIVVLVAKKGKKENEEGEESSEENSEKEPESSEGESSEEEKSE